MRWLSLVPLITTSAFAQYGGLPPADPGGVWTGYVGGWKPNGTTSSRFVAPGFRRPSVVFVPSVVPVAVPTQQQDRAAAEQAEQRRAWEAEQARLTQQLQLETERRLSAEREAMLQQQLEAERRLAAEREALAAEKLKLEQAERERARLAQLAPPPEPPRPVEPQTPGNDIYRWTDADGVVHYSTKVPAAAKPHATKVGGSR